MYNWMKLIHILGVVLFMGNIIVTALWAMRADRSGNPAVMRYAKQMVIKADWIFTLPGMILLVLGGYGAAGMGHIPLTTPWLLWSQVFFFASGAIWIGVLVPVQKKLLRLADAATEGQVSPEYRAAAKTWAKWGGIATLLPLIVTALMVLKPGG